MWPNWSIAYRALKRLSQLQTMHSGGIVTQKNNLSVGHYWFVFVLRCRLAIAWVVRRRDHPAGTKDDVLEALFFHCLWNIQEVEGENFFVPALNGFKRDQWLIFCCNGF